MPQSDGRLRVVIEGVRPEIDNGTFAVKRIIGEMVAVEADIFTDGHDLVAADLLFRKESEPEWRRTPMKSLGNDRWHGEFPVSELGRYRYSLEGWIDHFATWCAAMIKRLDSGQTTQIDYLTGAEMIDAVAARAENSDAIKLRDGARRLRDGDSAAVADKELTKLARRHSDRQFATRYGNELGVEVDRERARFSAWYEMFPRSCAREAGRHGTLRDCEARLPYVAAMGFDVLYLPPIHPIGHTARKGKNNQTVANPEDVGSPWAIGSEDGGHTSIEPRLGTFEDFERLMARAGELGLEIALDLAFQCSPDHPYVREHPEWFRRRPDGSIQYAENPPKKYQDIFPLNFDSPQWRELWNELKSVVLFWMAHGVRIFRVDNPHTKALPFWEWVIGEIKAEYPETIFLAEAFTRPKLMARLAKAGFSQSYTYFTWRNTSQELTDYFAALTKSPASEFFRANLWPNTPDILPENLQTGGRASFMIRLILAATLGANYGIYGPAFELCESEPLSAGSEEYLDSEKYELKHWDLADPQSLRSLIAKVNSIRRENPALQCDTNLRFHETDNPEVICYSKATGDLSDIIIVICNLDAFHKQSGWVNLNLDLFGIGGKFQAHDLLRDSRYLWNGPRNYFELTPGGLPAHVMKVRRWVRTERDFDYYF